MEHDMFCFSGLLGQGKAISFFMMLHLGILFCRVQFRICYLKPHYGRLSLRVFSSYLGIFSELLLILNAPISRSLWRCVDGNQQAALTLGNLSYSPEVCNFMTCRGEKKYNFKPSVFDVQGLFAAQLLTSGVANSSVRIAVCKSQSHTFYPWHQVNLQSHPNFRVFSHPQGMWYITVLIKNNHGRGCREWKVVNSVVKSTNVTKGKFQVLRQS